jgi:hypothetical protein
MQGVLHAMLLNKLKAVAAVVVAGFVLVTGAGMVYQKLAAAAQQPGNPKAGTPPTAAPDKPRVVGEQEPEALVPLSGDRAKALVAVAPVSDKMRKLLQDLFESAQAEVDERWARYLSPAMVSRDSLDALLRATKRLLKAERELSLSKLNQLEALQRHFDRMKKIEEIVQAKFTNGLITHGEVEECRYFRIEAEISVERAKAGRMPAPED